MTKSNRAKKAKKADFSKVKIKLGKPLKKAQNETRVDFKVRKIILKEQFADKDSSGQLITKKKHTIKELQSRLTHQSVYVRQDGINGVKELLAEHNSATLIPYLPVLVPRLAFCILDLDAIIRSNAVKIIEALIIKMREPITAYYEAIISHLACAMVHMNIGVQGDSLQLMHVLIKHTPSLVARYADKILKNFINLISRKVSSTQNQVVNVTRSLLVSPDNKLTSLKWRIKLWKQLSSYLQTIMKERTHNHNMPTSLWQAVMVGCEVSGKGGLSHVDKITFLNDPEEFKTFVSSLVPLLFQTWAEVDPRRQAPKMATKNGLTETGLETLESILELLLLLYNISLHRNFDQPEKVQFVKELISSQFNTHILQGFPYECEGMKQPGKKKNKYQKNNNSSSCISLNPDCHNVNITICDVAMKINNYSDSDIPQDDKLIAFVQYILSEENNNGKYSMARLTDVVIELLKLNNSNHSTIVNDVVSSCLTCYKRIHHLKKDRQHLLHVLIEVTSMKYRDMWGYSSIEYWCKQLISDLVAAETTEPTIKIIMLLRQRNVADINNMWKENFNKIHANIEAKQSNLLPLIKP